MVEMVTMSRTEFYHLAEVRENCLVDWENGGAIRMAPAHSRHGYFISYLHVPLNNWLKARELGRAWQEVFVDFADRTCGVDVAVLLTDNLGRHRRGRIHGLPDIIVEVVSEDSESRDRSDKFDYYWSQRVPWYWIGDPAAGTLEEYRWTPEGYKRTSSGTVQRPFSPRALLGFTVLLSDLLDVSTAQEEQPQ
jgi:Uma2 family endonuclease